MENQGQLQNTRNSRVLITVAILALLFTLTSVLSGKLIFKQVTNVVTPVTALATTLFCAWAYFDKRDDHSRPVFLGLAIGFGLWTIAEILWVFFSIFLNDVVPYPSIADLAWVIGYIPLIYALVKRIKTLKVIPTRTQVHFLRTFGAAWLVITAIFVLLPIITTLEMNRLLEGLISITYPLADMVLAFLSCQVLVLMQKGRFSLAWRLIFAGILLNSFSDNLYSYATWQGLYYPESGLNFVSTLIDLNYIYSYLIIGLGVQVYCTTRQIKDTYTLSLETMPSARYYTFFGTDRENRIISLSDNFYYLVNAQPDTPFLLQPLDRALGIHSDTLLELNRQIASKDILVHYPQSINTVDLQPVNVWITAKAFFDTDQSFNGASFAITAEISAPEEVRLPRNRELLSMMNYLISLAGSRPQDEIQTIQTYFLEMIRMLSSMLFHYGGPEFKQALFAHLEQIVREKNLPIKFSEDVITLTEEYKGKTLAEVLTPVLHSARAYVCDLVGEQAVNEEIEDLEKQLSPTALHDLDKYRLRAFHLV